MASTSALLMTVLVAVVHASNIWARTGTSGATCGAAPWALNVTTLHVPQTVGSRTADSGGRGWPPANTNAAHAPFSAASVERSSRDKNCHDHRDHGTQRAVSARPDPRLGL